MATRQARVVLPAMAYSASANVTQDLSQTGYLAAINLLMTGTVTTAAASTTTVNTFIQTPWNIVKRIILRTNEGADIWSTTGWGAYLYNRHNRTGLDYHTNHADYLRAAGVDPFSRYLVNPGTLAQSLTSDIRAFWRLPIAWGEMNLTGLLLLQNPGVRFTLEIQWGNVATNGDLFASTTGTVTVANLQVLPQLELYHLPASSDDDPNLAFAKTVLEDRKDIVSVGDVVYNPIMGNVYNRVIQEYVNGGTAPMSPADITQFAVSFAQTQRVYTENADVKLADQRRIYGQDMPEGVYTHEFSLPNGFPELPGGRDQFDTSQITDMAITASLRAGMTLNAGSYVRNIREQLVTIQG